MAAIAEVSPIDWNALLSKENVTDILVYAPPKPSHRVISSPQAKKGSCGRSPRNDSRKSFSRLSLGGAPSKQKQSSEVEGYDAEEEESEVLLDRKSSRHRTNNG